MTRPERRDTVPRVAWNATTEAEILVTLEDLRDASFVEEGPFVALQLISAMTLHAKTATVLHSQRLLKKFRKRYYWRHECFFNCANMHGKTRFQEMHEGQPGVHNAGFINNITKIMLSKHS